MRRIPTFTSLAIVLAVLSFASEKYTRGVGVYPGDPDGARAESAEQQSPGQGREAAAALGGNAKRKALKGRHSPCAALSGLNSRPTFPGACAPGSAVSRFQRLNVNFETASGDSAPHGETIKDQV
jgi:hypothetical protein